MKKNNLHTSLFAIVVILNGLAVLYVLAIYAYGGFYSRPVADDYCQAVYLAQSQNVFDAIRTAYKTWLNSYTILFFTQAIESVGIWGFRLMSGITILFWAVNTAWLVYEIGRSFALRLNAQICVWLAGLGIFVSFYQTPVLYQILYWRTGMIPYTLPLAFFAGVAAFVMWYARQPYERGREIRMRAAMVLLIVFISGLCETTSALEVGILFLASTLAGLWWWSKRQRKDIAQILTLSLLAAVISLLVIAFSPGTSTRLGRIMSDQPLYNPFELGIAVIIYTAQFLWDNLKVAPLPISVATLASFGIVYFQSVDQREESSPISTSHLWQGTLLLFVLMFIAIGFSFAPSAFVLTYPVARARFAAHFVMNFSLILMGGALGMLASRMKYPFVIYIGRSAALILLGALSFYPFYTSSKILTMIPTYRSYATAWDQRDVHIRSAIATGAKDLTVKQLDSPGGVLEYKGDKTNWVNVCAAQYYGLDSIIAP